MRLNRFRNAFMYVVKPLCQRERAPRAVAIDRHPRRERLHIGLDESEEWSAIAAP